MILDNDNSRANVRQLFESWGASHNVENARAFYRRMLEEYYKRVKVIRLHLLEAASATVQAALLRKSDHGAKDASGSIARLADGDIPLDSVKSDLRRKKALRSVMGKHEDEEMVRPDESDLDDFLGLGDNPEDVCHDENGDVVDCDDPSAVDAPLDEADMTDDEKKFAKEDVNYRYAANPDQKCGNCKHCVAASGSCEIVSGLIRSTHVGDQC